MTGTGDLDGPGPGRPVGEPAPVRGRRPENPGPALPGRPVAEPVVADAAIADPAVAEPPVADPAVADPRPVPGQRVGKSVSPVPGGALPVAGPVAVRRAALRLLRAERGPVTALLLLNALAAGAGLVGPWLVGRIVDEVQRGHGTAAVDRLSLAVLLCAGAQFVLARYASLVGYRFGERASARVREGFVGRALALPAGEVERAGTGDLTARGTADVDTVASSLRDILPEVLIALAQALFVLGAVLVISPVLGLCALLGLGGIPVVARWYLRRAPDAYLADGAANSAVAGTLAATAEGARTVELLGLGRRRVEHGDRAVARAYATRRATLRLRSVLFPVVDLSYAVPVVAVLLLGGLLHHRGALGLGAVVSCALYLRQLPGPLDTVLQRLEQLQSARAAFARVEGLPEPAPAGGAVPEGDLLEVRGLRFGYGDGPDVLRGVDLTVRPGERLAVVGASGAGKTTLGHLLAGLDSPRAGQVTVGGAPVAALRPALLRRHVVLVTQHHHVFLGSLRDNLRVAAPGAEDARLLAALAVVGADWVGELPEGLDTAFGESGPHGAGGAVLDGARAQQVALARVVLADPHTLILDEATALLDPTTARRTERALAAVLEGRTVIAIAHRLHTAHDADRIAVMAEGGIAELGSHEELVAAGGRYAALWAAWQGGREG